MMLILFSGGIVALAGDPAQQYAEGVGNYFVTGESYPTSIIIAGYNARDQKLYLNLEFETTKNTIVPVEPTETVTFNYYVQVLDGQGVLLGNIGTDAAPTTTEATGQATAEAINKEISLTSSLTTQFRTVVTVQSVTKA